MPLHQCSKVALGHSCPFSITKTRHMAEVNISGVGKISFLSLGGGTAKSHDEWMDTGRGEDWHSDANHSSGHPLLIPACHGRTICHEKGFRVLACYELYIAIHSKEVPFCLVLLNVFNQSWIFINLLPSIHRALYIFLIDILILHIILIDL